MIALRWTRRLLDLLLVVAVLAVVATAALQLLAPIAGGRVLVIGGGSMEPTIDRGALALAFPAGAEGYAVGDVVTVAQDGSTPYTHRITRQADLKGVPHVETKGDANAAPDPALVPTAAIVGRIALDVPLLGYVAMLLGSGVGLAGFLAVCAAALILVWVIEDLEDQRCPVCAVDAAASGEADVRGLETPAAAMFGGAFALSALPAFAAPMARARVRETGRARATNTPVLLERDRRNPRRRGIATMPIATGPDAGSGRAPAPATTSAAADTTREVAA
jgi:signal peptidase